MPLVNITSDMRQRDSFFSFGLLSFSVLLGKEKKHLREGENVGM